MKFKDLQKNWNQFGKEDPMWAIITRPGMEGGKWDKESFFETGRKEINRTIRYLQLKSIQIPKGRALDFGCGIGRLTQALAPHFNQVYGVDIAPTMIEMAVSHNQYADKCQYFLNEVDDLALFEDQSFAFIYSNITLQHMEPRYAKKYIAEFLRLLAPGGKLLFQLPGEQVVPEKSSLAMRVRIVLRHVFGNLPDQVYTRIKQLTNTFRQEPHMEMYGIPKEEVCKLLTRPGIQIVDITNNNNAGKSWISYQYLVSREE
ncbi:MAG: class I SAM-dependent methyltransferase [Saprospiraceae bacterium]|jgi:ubiquinone/menaquinone biosynthesis C-methylase UbiE|nr:class I SAM-dependent methyltransferase [Saprospiraceae bacterium]